MQNNKTILDIIFSSYDQFFEAEKKIADYIINHSNKVVNMSVAELAQASGSSDASVSRFCRKIGLQGFHHLKISLAVENVNKSAKSTQVTNEISRLNIGQSLQNILAHKVEELTQTVAMMNEKEILKVIDLIMNARLVQVAAVGNTIPVAIDASFKFNQIGITAISTTIWETQLATSLNLTKDDVVLVISNSGESRKLLTLIEKTKKGNVVVVSITNNENSSIAKLSDYHITTATREKLLFDKYCFSRVSAITVIEILFLLMVSENEVALNKIGMHEDAIAGDKF